MGVLPTFPIFFTDRLQITLDGNVIRERSDRFQMIHLRLQTLLLLTLLLFPSPARAEQGIEKFDDDRSPEALKVLFVGNSFTASNNMPAMFAEMVKSSKSGRPLKIHMVAFPSYTLREHLEDSRTMHEIEQAGPWDFVVLQERSFFPIMRPRDMESACIDLDQKIRATGAKTVLLETWSDADQFQDQIVINECYRNIGRKLNARVIPAGEAWQRAEGTGKLYNSDRHHPSQAGSFLVACVVYNSLTGKDARSLSSDAENELGISSGLAKQLKGFVNAVGSGTAPTARVQQGKAKAQSPSTGAQTKGVSTYNWKR